jgi:hypothetical protein
MIQIKVKENVKEKAWWDVLRDLSVYIVKNPQTLCSGVQYTIIRGVKHKIWDNVVETTMGKIYNYLFTCIELI